MLPLALTLVTSSSMPKPPLLNSKAHSHNLRTYLPAWQQLFLREGSDAAYPMPAASDVQDLLKALAGVKGLALRTNPATTVTEGMR